MYSSEGVGVQERVQAIQQKAHELFKQKINWATFFREILGKDGIVHKLYSDEKSLVAFHKTKEYLELQEMLNQLRDANGQPPPADEGTRVITVRLPTCLHEALKEEAYLHKTSMNQLCISKLLRQIETDAEPSTDETPTDA